MNAVEIKEKDKLQEKHSLATRILRAVLEYLRTSQNKVFWWRMTQLCALTFGHLLVLRLLCFPPILPLGYGDAEFGFVWEPGAVKHIRPGEAERAHHWHAAIPYGLAQVPAGADRPADLRQTHRSEERA